MLITFFIKYLHHVTWNNDKLTWVDSQLHIQHSSIKQNLPLWYNLLLTKRVAIYTFRVINGLSIGSWKGKIDLWCAMFHYTLDMPFFLLSLSIETIACRTDNRTWNLVWRENASTLLNKPFYGIIPFLSWKLYITPNAASQWCPLQWIYKHKA